MASILKLKPTRKEIIELISQALLRRAEQRQRDLNAEHVKIKKGIEKRQAEHREKFLKTFDGPEAVRLRALRKAAKKLGLVEQVYDNGLQINFRAEVNIKIANADIPKATKDEQAALDRIGREFEKVRNRHIDPSCIVAYLADGDTDLLKQVEAVAAKISESVESSAVKLLSGTVE